jgi:restriction system protein
VFELFRLKHTHCRTLAPAGQTELRRATTARSSQRWLEDLAETLLCSDAGTRAGPPADHSFQSSMFRRGTTARVETLSAVPRQSRAVRAVMVAFALALALPAFAASAPQLRVGWPALRTAGPWAAGVLLVLGPVAYMRFIRRRPASGANSSIESVRGLSRREFERIVGESFRVQGYEVDHRGTNEFADSVCLVLRKPGHRILVRCIHRTGVQVGVEAVRTLHEVMSLETASGGLIVTSEELSSDARAWVADKPIGLIEGRALLELVNRGRVRRPEPREVTLRREPILGPPLAELLDCPLCGAPMVLRQGESRSQAEFFGCSVPRCPGTRPA